MNSDWQRYILASSGYLELGMLDDAALALEKIAPPDKDRVEVLGVHLALELIGRKWRSAASIAGHLVNVMPENPSWWIQMAYAVRRCESIEKAEPLSGRPRSPERPAREGPRRVPHRLRSPGLCRSRDRAYRWCRGRHHRLAHRRPRRFRRGPDRVGRRIHQNHSASSPRERHLASPALRERETRATEKPLSRSPPSGPPRPSHACRLCQRSSSYSKLLVSLGPPTRARSA